MENEIKDETTVEKKPSFWKSLKFSSVKEEMKNVSVGSKVWINIGMFAGVYSGYLIGKKFANSKLPTTENDNEDSETKD